MAEREQHRIIAEAQAPGKLYIAGEYAVVEHGHPAILVAVNRMLTVRVTGHGENPGEGALSGDVPGNTPDESSAAASLPLEPRTAGSIRSQGHDEAATTWHRDAHGRCVPDEERPGAAYLVAAIQCVEELARAAGIGLRVFDIDVTSDLDDVSGRKYGLGSSAAVTVAAMRALLRFYGLESAFEPLEQYKMAFAIACRAGNVGSGGDLAASLFGGCIRFCSPDRDWVGQRLDDTALPELIRMSWPDLSVTRLPVFGSDSVTVSPAALRLLVGWTGKPASTADLVTNVQHHSTDERERRYREFLEHSDRCVDALCEALAQSDMAAVREHIAQARELLHGLSSLTGTLIETPRLTALVETAIAHGAAAKSSGAGGGDCGIAIIGVESDMAATETAGFIDSVGGATADESDAESAESAVSAIFQDWRLAGIEPLDLAVCAPLAKAPQWQTKRSSRKDDHVRLALQQHEQEPANAFDDVRFIHHALCGMSVNRVDTATTVCGARWELPFYINAMTGGSQRTGSINAALARAAQATGIAIASGSQHAALRDPELAATFTAIREQSQGFVFANVGPTVTPQQAVQAVTMLNANALQVHVNLAQEIVMPEGNRDFSGWPQHIREIIAASPVPVVVKEVGFGMSRRSVEQLAALGARTVDVSGRGGTDFAAIENSRRSAREYGYLDGWGQSTVLCLLDCCGFGTSGESSLGSVDILASGGVRNPLDVVKALALGAKAVGVSGHFLRVLEDCGESGLVDEINAWAEQLRSLMALLGASTVADLQHTDLLLGGTTLEQATLLGVDAAALAHRSA
ncbi:type 2 isopentenyl-diphosphate Delta-isomerase [Bifidobacterium tibiigranuli]|jgi:isopentenyl-diphosphate delta-isomerase|uniref:type 2 isopentenyl-diphosphate Delta-isomerase n=1 Tax=Bifidobacterium tibiigranuli TaxID=2172043 RepID=UPI0026EE7707|nr:type 2 isopentenyl-diphosphate Delta-isomerase [Bifidobacterium tibiigranuli]MCI1649431.1 type 2 isopentenyl-diphosphate Delta-isomerase [Bifidobacterium tibiigranuli]MCI1833917.1 type 2 isopentenyl-diphosphate Delta-isomerase [Bifidobacterium tibiigranuli]MCI2186207.1 type 2 isopentenyl-diphosphate Delta-isomerase [Bifidobacterium tibiigranuli]MCI2203966.1 type 2 isopentenyl-diphosphate Delta-isomerase [Bifidobacterium tibiigranuli]